MRRRNKKPIFSNYINQVRKAYRLKIKERVNNSNSIKSLKSFLYVVSIALKLIDFIENFDNYLNVLINLF